jgi:hypothetical protein
MRKLLFLLAALVSAQVSALPITGLFNTGVDNGGVVLGDGAADGHYAIVAPSQAAVVINAGIPGSWLPNTSDSRWIWETASGQPTNVTRVFRTTFDLTGFDISSVNILGRWAADNLGLDIVLNGVSTGQTSPGFTSWTNFNLPSASLVAGLNTLDFTVNDFGVISGFRAEFLRADGNLANNVPEPASLSLAVLGLVLVGKRRLRRA